MIEITINNIDELVDKISNIKLKETLNTSLRKSLFLLERELKIVTPVDTWLLRNSYEQQPMDLEARLMNFREYGVYVDARQWFVQRWIDNSEEQIMNIFNNDINILLSDL